MEQKIILDLFYIGGGRIRKELSYLGSEEEIARLIDRDNNALLEYMEKHDDHGIKSFCFSGFMFSKEGLLAAHMYEPEF